MGTFKLVGCVGIEPTANGLKVHCSTAELTARFLKFSKRALLATRAAGVKLFYRF